MAGSRRDARPQSVRIEPWEIEVARSVARSFRGFSEHDDLEAELFRRLIEIKSRGRPPAVASWRDFLARSLYNAGIDHIRRWESRHKRLTPLDAPTGGGEDSPTLEEVLAAPEEPADLRLAVGAVWDELSQELRELWDIMVEEQGNKAAAARRLGRPRKTVEYWISKISKALKRRGLGGD
ncbi:MAG: hypothetical protein HY748_00895 [Elusimicrobia bacterium]|nr:hypothetical protein [Elusimicrobiota bacterium]